MSDAEPGRTDRCRRDPPDECDWRACDEPPVWEAFWKQPRRDYAYVCADHRGDVQRRDAPHRWRSV